MNSDSLHQNMDPRDPPCLQVRDYPDPPLHLVPRPLSVEAGISAASIHLSRQAQQSEREQAITANLEAAADDLNATQLTDSVYAARVAAVLPADVAVQDRRDAGAVAVRLHDPYFQMVTRYRAADVTLVRLRNLLGRHGLACVIPDSELRTEADAIAGATQIARMQAWIGTAPVTVREWAKAKLGILVLTEDR